MGRMIKKRIDVKTSYEEQIEALQKEIELLSSLIPLREYFLKIKDNQNSFVVEMRKLVMEDLFGLGLNQSEVGRILTRHHSSIIHLKKLDSDDYVKKHVKMYYKDWIANDLYPMSISKSVTSYLHPTGWKSVRTYKLININDEKETINS